MNRTVVKRLEALERARAEPERGVLLGVITYSDGTEEKVYSNKTGRCRPQKRLLI